MFEKEAEEYGEKDLGGKYLSSVVAKDKLHAYKLGQYDGFIAGAEFGYNKCKEELNQKGLALQSDMDKTIEQNIALKKELNKDKEWHYVKDGKPKDNEYVLIYTDIKNVYIARLVKDDYFITNKGGFVQMSAVIAWKEIVLPELKESE